MLPFWDDLRNGQAMQAAMRGANAAVVGNSRAGSLRSDFDKRGSYTARLRARPQRIPVVDSLEGSAVDRRYLAGGNRDCSGRGSLLRDPHDCISVVKGPRPTDPATRSICLPAARGATAAPKVIGPTLCLKTTGNTTGCFRSIDMRGQFIARNSGREDDRARRNESERAGG